MQISATPGGVPITVTSSASFSAYWGIMQSSDSSSCLSSGNCGFYDITVTLTARSKGMTVTETHNTHVYTYNVPTINKFTGDVVRFRSIGGGASSGLKPYCSYVPKTITAASVSGGVLTLTVPNHGTYAYNGVSIRYLTGVTGYSSTPALYNATIVDANTVTIPCSGCSGSYSGTNAILEIYPYPNITQDQQFDVNISGANRISGTDGNASLGCSATNVINGLASQYGPNTAYYSGWEEVLTNSQAASSSPVVGLALGDPALLSESEGALQRGPGFYDHPSATADQGFSYWDLAYNGAFYGYYGTTVMASMIWVSTNADVPAATTLIQPIMLVHNTIAGLNQNHINSYTLNFPDPVGGWQPPFLTSAQTAYTTNLLASASSQTAVCGSSGCLTSAVAQDGTGGNPAISSVLLNGGYHVALDFNILGPFRRDIQHAVYQWLNGQGQFDTATSGYQAWGQYANCSKILPESVSALSSASSMTAYDKTTAKAASAYCGVSIYDPSFQTPDPTVSFGLANQQAQLINYKVMAALFNPSNPQVTQYYSQAIQNAYNSLLAAINPYGSGYGSWHYQGAATNLQNNIWVNFVNYQNLSAANFPAIQNFGRWYLSGLTPPEVRYGKTRKYFGNGDGNTEAEPDLGLLATIINPSNPTLAQQLQWGWLSQGLSGSGGGNLGNYFVPQLLAQDFSIPHTDPQLTTQHFPGYHSVLRSGWGTGYENAVDFLYGGFYSPQGHAHPDTGRVAMYLLGAPISIDWAANLYNPDTPGRFDHSSVVLDSEFTSGNWTTVRPCCGDGSEAGGDLNIVENTWSVADPDNTVLTQTASFTDSSSATAYWTKSDGTVWNRQTTLFNGDPNYAVVHVYDTFTGAQASGSKVLTWNLMGGGTWASGNSLTSQYPVTTPSGSITPNPALSIENNGVYPTSNSPTNATAPYSLTGNGLQQFAFTGATWSNHPSDGVDFDFYTQNANGDQFTLGHWCNSENNNNTNNCSLESQDILRIHGTGNFDSIIVARTKGEADPLVSQQACGVQVQLTGTLCFDPHYSIYDNGKGTLTLATYDGSAYRAFGMTIAGSPAECVQSTASITCTAQAFTPGVSTITLPAGYYPQQPIAYDSSGNVLAYSENGVSAQFSFTTTPVTMRSVSMTAPTGGSYERLKLASSVDSSTPYLTRVPSGATILLQVPPGTYQAQWIGDSSSSQVFSIVVR